MDTIAHKGSTMQEQIGTLMDEHHIEPRSIGATQEIRTVEEAVQWLHQKMKTAESWTGGSKRAGQAVTVAGAVGAAAGGLALGPGAALIGAGVALAGTALGSDPASSAVSRTGRMLKGAYKDLRGTRGVHRAQAAEVLVGAARNRHARDHELAYAVLLVFYEKRNLDRLLRYSVEEASVQVALRFTSRKEKD